MSDPSFGAVSTAKYFAPQLLAAFWKQHPDVDVKLFIGNRDDTIRGLAASGTRCDDLPFG